MAMRITGKGQVTIPQTIRERCGLTPHTEVEFIVEDGRVVLRRLEHGPGSGQLEVEHLRQARLPTRLSTDELLALTRGEDPPR